MVIDSHCHAWAHWPYRPAVPDPESRGRVEQLLYEMDVNGVDQALIVCAQIAGNPENNEYVAEAVAQHPGRLYQVVDLDSSWSDTYHKPGAADRLRYMAERWPVQGFTHYLAREDDGAWLTSSEGLRLFQTAAEFGLAASLSSYPHQHKAIRGVAERFPSVPILIHHLGHVRVGEEADPGDLQEVLASARLPNIYIKVSGFYYATEARWNYPYPEVQTLVRAEYEHFGPHRLCWGSDYPVARAFITYRQALDLFRTHCSFVPETDQHWVLGDTLHRLLTASSQL